MQKIPVQSLQAMPLEKGLYHESGFLLFGPGEALTQEEIGLLKLYGIKKVYEMGHVLPATPEGQDRQLREVNVEALSRETLVVGPLFDAQGTCVVEADVVLEPTLLDQLKAGSATRLFQPEDAGQLPEAVRAFRRARQDLLDWKELERTLRPTLRPERKLLHPAAELVRDNLSRLLLAEVKLGDPHGLPLKDKVRAGSGFRDREDAERGVFLDMRGEFLRILDLLFEDLEGGRKVRGAVVSELARKLLVALLKDRYLLLDLLNLKEDVTRLSGHALNVAIASTAIGLEMGYNQDRVFEIVHAAFLHDVGMLRIPRDILERPAALTTEDWEVVRAHPRQAIETLRLLDEMPQLVPVVCYQEHERLDGSGYPEAGVQEGIALTSQIVAVADVYDAIASPRPYRLPKTPHAAIRDLVQLAARRILDARCVRALMRAVSLYPIGTWVELTNGGAGPVVGIRQDAARPLVRILEHHGEALSEPPIIDLHENPGLHVKHILTRPMTLETVFVGF